AVKNNNIKWIQVALEAGFDVNWSDPVEDRRAIDVALCTGRLSVLKLLLNQPNIDLTLEDAWGMTVLDKIHILKKKNRVPLDTLEDMHSLITSKLK
ncbi:hypothetical protein CU098_009686, partial [Rhizopus stolonifer]